MNKLIRYCILFLAFMLCALLYVKGQKHYNYTLINEDTKASLGSVQNIFQDSSGVLWLGILGKGLHYYAGDKIQRMRLDNEAIFSHQKNMFSSYNEYLILKGEHELTIFDPIVQSITDTIEVSKALPNGQIEYFTCRPSQNSIYALYKLENEKSNNHVSRYMILISKNYSQFELLNTEIYFSQDGSLIKSYNEGLIIKDTKGLVYLSLEGQFKKRFPLDDFDLTELNNSNTVVDENGVFWFGKGWQSATVTKGDYFELYTLNLESSILDYMTSVRVSRFNAELNNGKRYLRKLILKDDYIYINGKVRYNKLTKKSNYLFEESVSLNFSKNNVLVGSVNDVHIDNMGTTFFGCSKGLGILVPKSQTFKKIPLVSSRGFLEDHQGNIYGGSSHHINGLTGINKYNPKSNEVINISNAIHWYSPVMRRNKIYFNNNVFDVNTKELNVFNSNLKPYKDYNYGTISNLLMNNNELWKTSWNIDRIDVFDINTTKLKKSIRIPELSEMNININQMYLRQSDSTVWLGTFGKGVFVISKEGNHLHHLTTLQNSRYILDNNYVTSFYEDSSNTMWLGHGSGLSMLDTKLDTIVHYTINEDDPDYYVVYGIVEEDNKDYLWLSTNEGIFRFSKKSGSFSDFPLDPDIMKTEFNRTSYLKSKEGRVYFGNPYRSNANIAFYPHEVVNYYETRKDESKILFTYFKQHDNATNKLVSKIQELKQSNQIILNPGDKFFELTFAISDYRYPHKNKYSYYLENYDDTWNNLKVDNNKIHYENLPPGEYILKLKGALIPHNADITKASIPVTIQPYWYQRLSTKIAFLLLSGSIIYLMYKYKVRRQIEIKDAEKLKEISELKTRLYTNITHEFRTPLTVIMGMNDNIQNHENEKKLIKRNSKNLLRLVNQLLDLSKLDSGQLQLKNVHSDIISYLKYLTESFYSMASDKKIHLSFESNIDQLNMDYDEINIQHIIYNLISNAIKFTRTGGKILINVAVVKKDNLEELIIVVQDTGIGMPNEELPFIFDRFYQVKKSDKESYAISGTGIGLALTKELVEMMEGGISVRSTKNIGTKFIVKLPIPQAKSSSLNLVKSELLTSSNEYVNNTDDVPALADHISNNKPHILIIEDNSGVIEYIKSILKDNYHISIAVNGQEGVDMAINLIPDLIITDVRMPEKNGFVVCSELKNEEKTSHIPIIMLTAKVGLASKIEGLEQGADAYIFKPFEKPELLVRIKKLLELRKTLQEKYSNILFNPKVELTGKENLEDAFLLKLNNVINEVYTNAEFTIPEMSVKMQMSHTQLYRKLKALTGKTPSQYIRSFRLKEAVALLKSKNMNISEVAFEVGFNDPNYFTKMFKKEYNILPTDL